MDVIEYSSTSMSKVHPCDGSQSGGGLPERLSSLVRGARGLGGLERLSGVPEQTEFRLLLRRLRPPPTPFPVVWSFTLVLLFPVSGKTKGTDRQRRTRGAIICGSFFGVLGFA